MSYFHLDIRLVGFDFVHFTKVEVSKLFFIYHVITQQNATIFMKNIQNNNNKNIFDPDNRQL